jgi:membrane-associated phospholipid phosphatase
MDRMDLFVKAPEDCRGIFVAFITIGSACFLAFLILPTTYPRPPLTPHFDLLNLPLQIVHQLDAPTNCLPSLHVGYAFLSALFVLKQNRLVGNLTIIWAMLVSLSTLTTKQHYVWDVVVGYALARLIFLFVDRKFRSKDSRSV